MELDWHARTTVACIHFQFYHVTRPIAWNLVGMHTLLWYKYRSIFIILQDLSDEYAFCQRTHTHTQVV